MDSGSPPSYWLTRFMILRLLGVVYAVAFLVAINQIVPLIGDDGLLPVGELPDAGEQRVGLGRRGLCAAALDFLVMAFRYSAFNGCLDWVYTIPCGSCWFCQRAAAGLALVPLYVLQPRWAGLVRVWLGNTAYGNRLPRNFSLPLA